jgi:hypothetical protein
MLSWWLSIEKDLQTQQDFFCPPMLERNKIEFLEKKCSRCVLFVRLLDFLIPGILKLAL